jgi:hypothetical protein
VSEARKKQVHKVRAGAPKAATQLPAHVELFLREEAAKAMPLHRIDASQLAANDVFLSEPPDHVSTDESRKERAIAWRRKVLPIVIVTACFLAALVMAFVN